MIRMSDLTRKYEKMQGESACDYIYVIYVISSGIISWSMR